MKKILYLAPFILGGFAITILSSGLHNIYFLEGIDLFNQDGLVYQGIGFPLNYYFSHFEPSVPIINNVSFILDIIFWTLFLSLLFKVIKKILMIQN